MKKTIENLAKAFIGESQARNRYTFYAKTARKEGFEKIAEIFEITADNEREHASQIFKLINELKNGAEDLNEIKVDAPVPTILSNTIDNLKSAIAGEHYENTTMYPEFADIADEENLSDIAKRLRKIAIAEKHHEDRYRALLAVVENNSVFSKDEEVSWVCRKCGYVHNGKEAPEECPACGHSKNYFEIKCEKY